MFLRSTRRIKDGKEHRYFSIVESRRVSSSRNPVQRPVLYLGEINDSQKEAWRKTLEVFDENSQRYRSMSLFPEDREIPVESVDSIQVKLSEIKLENARAYGDCWLGCHLWRQLKLDEFWKEQFGQGREGVPWDQVLELLVVNRLIDPGSEFRVHRLWFVQSAMADLLGADFAVAAKDRLYRCLDRLLAHKQTLFQHLRQRWQDLFQAQYEVLLYDLTSTYFEGDAELIPKARFGHSRDKRSDCRQVVIALVITPDGFPLAYEVMDGNTSDKTTLRGFLSQIETAYGKAHRVWVMDRGIPTKAVLEEMRKWETPVSYLVGAPRAQLKQMEAKWLELPWRNVRDSVQVKLMAEDGELYVLAKSEGRNAKERAMRRKKLVRLLLKLRAMRKSCPSRDQLLMRLGSAKKDAGRAYHFVDIKVPAAKQAVTKESFQFSLNKTKLKEAEMRDGHYLLRSNLVAEDPAVLWERYMQLTQIEAAFKNLKSDLGIRPIHHQKADRVEAHLFVAFMAYCLSVTLKNRLHAYAPGLTPKAVLESMAKIQMIDVSFPTTDGRRLVMPRYTEPEPEQKILLHKLKLRLPDQPPPRIGNTSQEMPKELMKM